MDYKKLKFDIIIIAGQSNAEGNGLPGPRENYFNEDVFELNDTSLSIFGYGETVYSKQDKFELGYASYRKASYRYCFDFSETFADEYIRNGFLEKDRKILLIKAAVGGTGFALNQWGVGNPLHNRLIDMVNYALSLNKENRLVGLLWHQGEHDAFEQKELDPASREKFYYSSLRKTFENIRTTFNEPHLPIVAGELVNDWANKNLVATRAIENATKEVCLDIGNALVASSEGLKSNHEEDNSYQDDIHFSMVSLIELGKRYFELYKEIRDRGI